jgi:hypothetical protein
MVTGGVEWVSEGCQFFVLCSVLAGENYNLLTNLYDCALIGLIVLLYEFKISRGGESLMDFSHQTGDKPSKN